MGKQSKDSCHIAWKDLLRLLICSWHWDFNLLTYDFWKQIYPLKQIISVQITFTQSPLLTWHFLLLSNRSLILVNLPSSSTPLFLLSTPTFPWTWVSSLSIILSHPIHFLQISYFHFSLQQNKTLCVYIVHLHNKHLGWFYILGIMNRAAINMNNASVSMLKWRIFWSCDLWCYSWVI